MSIPLKFPVAPVVSLSAYSANTVVGGLLTIASVPAQGVIRDILVNIDGAITPQLDLYFFDSAPTVINDTASFAPGYADQQKMLTGDKVSIVAGDYQTLNSKTRAHKRAVNLDYAANAVAGSYNLYLFIVSPGTPTFPGASALNLKVLLWEGKR